MENKSICYYCGTIYDTELGKCPLCGSTVKATQEETENRPAPRRRLTEQERRQRQRAARGKFSAQKENAPKNKPILMAAMVLLILAVVVVFYFIGDMIGWWPGLEDTVNRHNASVALEKSCQTLVLEPQSVTFTAPGKTAELKVSTNLSCEETVSCVSADESVVTVSPEAVTQEGTELKSVTFTLNAVAVGETDVTVTCGDKTAVCRVVCSDPESFVPVLDCGAEVKLSKTGDTVQLNVKDLPDGMSVEWSSSEPTVASVDENGLVTAVGKGETTVTATVNGASAEVLIRCELEDSSTPNTALDSGAHLEKGKEDVSTKVGEKFSLFLYDSKSEHIEDITYTVKDPTICKVENGWVTALKKGTTTITITYGSMTFECIVRVS